MIVPKVGRVVWFWPNGTTVVRVHNEEIPCDAHIAYVWTERMINVFVVDHNAAPFSFTSVPLLQDGDQIPPREQHYCTWMPYQVGQAALTQEAESKVEALLAKKSA